MKLLSCPGCKTMNPPDRHGYAVCKTRTCDWHFYDKEGDGMRRIPQAEIEAALKAKPKPTRRRGKKP